MAKVRRAKKIDLCKIRTDRLREMTDSQLEHASHSVGRLFEITKKDTERRTPRYLLSRFISNLRDSRRSHEVAPDIEARAIEVYRERYKKEPMTAKQTKAMYVRDTDIAERAIWDAQAKKKCQIPAAEQVARDAVRDGRSPATVDRIRRKRRPIIR